MYEWPGDLRPGRSRSRFPDYDTLPIRPRGRPRPRSTYGEGCRTASELTAVRRRRRPGEPALRVRQRAHLRICQNTCQRLVTEHHGRRDDDARRETRFPARRIRSPAAPARRQLELFPARTFAGRRERRRRVSSSTRPIGHRRSTSTVDAGIRRVRGRRGHRQRGRLAPRTPEPGLTWGEHAREDWTRRADDRQRPSDLSLFAADQPLRVRSSGCVSGGRIRGPDVRPDERLRAAGEVIRGSRQTGTGSPCAPPPARYCGWFGWTGSK